ncbi:hypothetical protein [Streptomyces sp. NPDC002994]|uniref:hypothetical protein n=1 Tax=Streptomyces sp. NPDC002994 TaxID=3154441 RepID=UPI0033BC58BA
MLTSLVAGATLAVALPGVGGSPAYAAEDFGGYGDGAYKRPADLPADGLKRYVALPFYQKDNLYLAPAGTTQQLVSGASQELTVENVKSTSQTITTSGEPSLVSQIGSVLGYAAMAYKFISGALSQGGGNQGKGDTLNITIPSSADQISRGSTVTFSQSNKIKLEPLRPMSARPVYYKSKTVSDLWRKTPDGNTHYIFGHNTADIVIAQGWLLECGDRACIPGKDFRPFGQSLDTGNVSSLPDASQHLLPTRSPDRWATAGADEGRDSHRGRVNIDLPSMCTVSDTVNPKIGDVKAHWGQIRVSCPPSAPFKDYRVQYSAWGPNWYGSRGLRGMGVISSPTSGKEYPGTEAHNWSEQYHQTGIPADGQTRNYWIYRGVRPSQLWTEGPWLGIQVIPVNGK